ncbi:MAG: hypothetical protein D3909_19095, partial [Candidatus Electrothrix sp. ATG1]|nr:hypothetical protein [Candidatus Electrothrix sp. ATG1]
TLVDWIKLPSFPCELFTITEAGNRLMGYQIGHGREPGKFTCMLPQPLVHDEIREVFSVEILAGRLRRLKYNGVMLYAKAITSAD